ncbi:MAG: SAM-dependent methyltransferase, partial [Lachnospiraceae bacterium]|nr:SAM-dependent methyltransferase [Lachnospiraceae bacterium]
IGDPLIYSTFSYIAAFAYADGFTVRYADGIPSFLSCASLLGIILGDGNEQIHIIPGSADIREALGLPGIKIFMKLGKHATELRKVLEESGREFLGAVSHCGMPDEEIYTDIDSIPEKKAYLMTAFVR